MAKKIRYPSDEWIDRYIDAHEGASIKDAEQVWWDNEIDHGNPTPFDLTEEQAEHEKAVRRKMAKAVDAYGKQTKRERKPNEDKREIVATIAQNLSRVCGDDLSTVLNVIVSNVERQIDFEYKGTQYSITLTAHRKPKGA